MPNIVLRQGAENPTNIILRDPNAAGTNYANATLISSACVLVASGTVLYGGIANLTSSTSTISTSGNIAKNVEIIQKTLKDFGVDVSMGDVNIEHETLINKDVLKFDYTIFSQAVR